MERIKVTSESGGDDDDCMLASLRSPKKSERWKNACADRDAWYIIIMEHNKTVRERA